MQARRLVSLAPFQMGVEEFEVPEAPAPGEVLVQAAVTAVSAGTEVANYRAITRNRPPDSTRPYYPGYSFAGRVLAVGEGVTDVAAGDRVCGMVDHASHSLADPNRLAPIPAGVTDAQAAMSTLGIIVLNAVRKPAIQLGEAVAVVGAGLIGQLACQLARLAGGRPVVALDLLPTRRALATRIGADVAFDPNDPDTPAALERLAPGSFPVVFEATGSNRAVNPALKLAGRGGRVVLLGSTRGLVDQFDPYGDIHLKGLTVIGAHLNTHMEAPNLANPWTVPANRRVILDLLRRGELNVDALISHRVAPSQAGAVYAGLAENPADYFGVLFDWSLP
jgi:2-desacetyl-2-hydroxyethyl bacteriochlorophyllide A dehydrogenase